MIRIHLTFLLFLVWIGVVALRRRAGSARRSRACCSSSLLFACVLLHEFGHVFAARRYGVQTPDITLLPIGGVARLERIPEKPRPGAGGRAGRPGGERGDRRGAVPRARRPARPWATARRCRTRASGLLERLAWVNIFLVLFNLIPAFPMDGGRVLRALLACRLGYAPRHAHRRRRSARWWPSRSASLGLFGNPLLIFIALFVYIGAAAEANAVQMRDASARHDRLRRR